jgi:hypothetical protein
MASTVKHGQRARIARELGISGAAVSKLARRGMPLTSPDDARRWRAAHLNPLKMVADPGPSPETLVQRVQEHVEVARVAMAQHKLELVADGLRAALREVPESHRMRVLMPRALIEALLGAHALAVLNEGPKEDPANVGAEDADFVGQIVYMLCCGEAQIT